MSKKDEVVDFRGGSVSNANREEYVVTTTREMEGQVFVIENVEFAKTRNWGDVAWVYTTDKKRFMTTSRVLREQCEEILRYIMEGKKVRVKLVRQKGASGYSYYTFTSPE